MSTSVHRSCGGELGGERAQIGVGNGMAIGIVPGPASYGKDWLEFRLDDDEPIGRSIASIVLSVGTSG